MLLLLAVLAASAYGVREPSVAVASRSGAPHRSTIDVNAAPWYQWILLEGIGEARARQIVERRQELGGFRRPRDLESVPGLTRAWLERVAPHLVLRGRPLEDWLATEVPAHDEVGP